MKIFSISKANILFRSNLIRNNQILNSYLYGLVKGGIYGYRDYREIIYENVGKYYLKKCCILINDSKNKVLYNIKTEVEYEICTNDLKYTVIRFDNDVKLECVLKNEILKDDIIICYREGNVVDFKYIKDYLFEDLRDGIVDSYKSNYMSYKYNIYNYKDSVYIQLPKTFTPDIIFGGVWEDISYKYKNLFLKISSDNVIYDSFDLKVDLSKFGVDGTYNYMYDNNLVNMFVDECNSYRYSNFDKDIYYYNNSNSSVVNIYKYYLKSITDMKDYEVRPVNIPVKVWKRIK